MYPSRARKDPRAIKATKAPRVNRVPLQGRISAQWMKFALDMAKQIQGVVEAQAGKGRYYIDVHDGRLC